MGKKLVELGRSLVNCVQYRKCISSVFYLHEDEAYNLYDLTFYEFSILSRSIFLTSSLSIFECLVVNCY